MKIVINNLVPIDPNNRYGSWDKRYKDVEDDYVLQENEEFSTDTEGLFEMKHLGKIDYKRYRSGLQKFGNVDDITWSDYSDEIKKQITREKATDYSRVVDVLTESGAIDAMSEFDKKSVKNRKSRFSKAKALLLNTLVDLEAFQILSELKTWAPNCYNLQDEYIEHGVEGFESSDPILGLYDYINGTTEAGNDAYGRSWSYFSAAGTLPGLAHRTFTYKTTSSITDTVTFISRLNDIIKKGK